MKPDLWSSPGFSRVYLSKSHSAAEASNLHQLIYAEAVLIKQIQINILSSLLPNENKKKFTEIP